MFGFINGLNLNGPKYFSQFYVGKLAYKQIAFV